MNVPYHLIAHEQHKDLLRGAQDNRLVEQAMRLQRPADQQPTLRERIMAWAARRSSSLASTAPQCCAQPGL